MEHESDWPLQQLPVGARVVIRQSATVCFRRSGKFPAPSHRVTGSALWSRLALNLTDSATTQSLTEIYEKYSQNHGVRTVEMQFKRLRPLLFQCVGLREDGYASMKAR